MIRHATPQDADALVEVCVRTARSGEDATGLFTDDRLWADLYALPYLALAPEHAYVIEDDDGVAGYVLGAPYSAAFAAAFRDRWLPTVADRYPLGPRPTPLEEQVLADLYRPERDLVPELEAYPAHLHIDLLPRAQGRGWGRALMRTEFRSLREAGAMQMHLGAAPDNHRAHAFYRHLGLTEVQTGRGAVYLVAPTDLL